MRALLRTATPALDQATTEGTEAAPTPKGIPYEKLSIGVPKESYPGERRVSQSPASVAMLKKQGCVAAGYAASPRPARAYRCRARPVLPAGVSAATFPAHDRALALPRC